MFNVDKIIKNMILYSCIAKINNNFLANSFIDRGQKIE